MYFLEDRIKRIYKELEGCIYPDSEPIGAYRMMQGDFKGGEAQGLDTSGWQVFSHGDRWGGRDVHCWFRTEAGIPERFDGKTVVYEVRTGREGQWDAKNPQFLAYVNGALMQGLDVNHREIVLSEKAAAGEVYSIALNAYSGMNEGLAELNTRLAVLDRDTERLYYNIKVPSEIIEYMDKNEKSRSDIINYLNEAINMLDLRKPFSESYYSSIRQANEFLESEFYGKYCGRDDVRAICVGHTHIDVAWLWTVAQTREKTARSFSTVLSLMKQYPEYTFMSSQPQLYKFIKEDYPQLYEQIRERIKEGRWEAEGAMWLEADCNLSSGESLVRQVLFGTRFFEKEFGVRNKILWLPDVFGYSAALPQILKKSGIDYFMTTKISWNEYNKVPYDTFMWKGIDGTEVFTHFITTTDADQKPDQHWTTYVGHLVPTHIIGAWRRYQHKDLNNEVLVSYGYGDGGGGPTKEMLENGRRMAKGIPGCPKVEMGKPLDYFKRLEKTVSGKRRLPKWAGELYLEYHRGTYTSMARNKKFNRKSELLYQDAELLSVISMAAAGGAAYPQDKINSGWETILLNQFHDILPGSSIKEVYEDSTKDYLRIIKDGNGIIDRCMDNICGKMKLKEPSVIVFNQLGFERSDIVEFKLPEGYDNVEIHDCSGNLVPSQLVADCPGENTSARVVFLAANVPAKGYKAFTLRKAETGANTGMQFEGMQLAGVNAGMQFEGMRAMCMQSEGIRSVDTNCGICADEMKSGISLANMSISPRKLSNRYFDITLDDNANFISIYDKVNGREVLKQGEKANVLQAFEDKPITYDAWDINIYYQEKMWEINDVESIQVAENGPVRSCLEVRRKFLDSSIVQKIYIYNDIPRIDFANTIDWKEKQILLKAAFPVEIHSDKASYEIQYGNVERPTHWNTSWDYARFEVCAHKWADLSEDGYGVSLINDCKYGHDIRDGNMRLTLLKSATNPNVDADREVHDFTYSLYPHSGGWRDAGTVNMAYSLNCPMYARVEKAHEGTLPQEFSLAALNAENVVLEVVKKAEDSSDIIIRVYECFNRRTKAKLTFFRELTAAFECDLLENDTETLAVEGNSLRFEIKPYEIKTFKLRMK